MGAGGDTVQTLETDNTHTHTDRHAGTWMTRDTPDESTLSLPRDAQSTSSQQGEPAGAHDFRWCLPRCSCLRACVQVYHSSFVGQQVPTSCGAALLPLKTKVKGPAPPAKSSQHHRHQHTRRDDTTSDRETHTQHQWATSAHPTGGRPTRRRHGSRPCSGSMGSNDAGPGFPSATSSKPMRRLSRWE